MKNRLSPELQQIQDEFVENLDVGGLEAVKPIVTRLAIERAMLEAYHGTFVGMEQSKENLVATGIVNEFMDEIAVVDFAADLEKDYSYAVGRHTLAVEMLGNVLRDRT